MTIMTYIGIDVSKDSFVAAYPTKSGYTTKSFLNTTSGVRKFISSLPSRGLPLCNGGNWQLQYASPLSASAS